MLSGLREKIRDKTRDKLAAKLLSLGVPAELASRGRPEERIGKPRFQRSLGIIDIADGPIRWINIVKRDGSKDRRPAWRVVMGVPFENPLAPVPVARLRTNRIKTVPLIGQVAAVEWQGDDQGLGLIDSFTADIMIAGMAKELGNFDIRSHQNGFPGWTITLDRKMTPTSLGWQVLQRMAQRLLSAG